MPSLNMRAIDFVLTLVERAAMLLVELRLGDVEIHAPDGVVLRFENSVREIVEPVCNLESLLLRSSAA